MAASLGLQKDRRRAGIDSDGVEIIASKVVYDVLVAGFAMVNEGREISNFFAYFYCGFFVESAKTAYFC